MSQFQQFKIFYFDGMWFAKFWVNLRDKIETITEFILLYDVVKQMRLDEQKIERRRFKRHKVNRRPIAILGPDPVRVGHLTIISDEAVEIQFSETNGKAASNFSELVVILPDFNNPYLSGKIYVETVTCITAPINGSRLQSQMRKCVISLNSLDPVKRRHLRGACL